MSIVDPDSPKSFPSNEAKHKLLCFELKQLYIAITRTRQRLWVFLRIWRSSINLYLTEEIENCPSWRNS